MIDINIIIVFWQHEETTEALHPDGHQLLRRHHPHQGAQEQVEKSEEVRARRYPEGIRT